MAEKISMEKQSLAAAVEAFRATREGSRRILLFDEPGLGGVVTSASKALHLPVGAMAKDAGSSTYMMDIDDGRIEVLSRLGAIVIDGDIGPDLEALKSSPHFVASIHDSIVGLPEEIGRAQGAAGGVQVMGNSLPPQHAFETIGLDPGRGLDGEGVVVGILDSGIDPEHPDFITRMGSTPFRDFTMTAHGDAYDDHGHGTHIAGIIAGPRGPGSGYGVAPGCRLVIAKVLRTVHGYALGPLSDVLKGAEWAADKGARVLNMSLGVIKEPDVAPDPSLLLAAQMLWERGVVLVAAAGNDSGRNDQPPIIAGLLEPAAWGLPPVLAVGAVDATPAVAYFSNAGRQMCISAPGVDIPSAWPAAFGGPYALASGTSQACAFVSGVLALMLQLNGQLTPRLACAGLQRNAMNIPGAHPQDVGAGVVQVPP